MVQRVDYYAVLSRAVQSLERDAYAARGAIYDREHKALLKRLISSSAPCSDADIAREEEAFRDAVRRIEFPDNPARVPPTARREPAETTWPSTARDRPQGRRASAPEPVIEPERVDVRQRRKPLWDSNEPEPEESPRRPIGPDLDFQPDSGADASPEWPADEGKRRLPFLKVIIVYVLITAIVLGAAALGYAYVMGWVDFSRLQRQAGTTVTTEQARLYDEGQAGQDGAPALGKSAPALGKATWRTRGDPGKQDLVVLLDAEIAEPPVALEMTLSHVTDSSSGMSHLLELRFQNPAQSPLGGVSRISNISMRSTPDSESESLVGTSINVASGQFMFGLLAMADVVQQNLQRLRKQDWLDFSLVFGNGAAYTLSVQKGASGERVIDEALASWGQLNQQL
ncbi:MAG TPA: hypothetical protein VKW08_06230 [Xanthobacteraceae bacterium]|nr:hypothetical protein [Xanthobacteraceae bacterium]